ncbi:hypothetical protein GQ53DRAFT_39975 [Thozetella sp. PMI_491]|nr:hypothetical protein GQ53DRAFT_39975 [Thozetella sp. PMI_491]
MVAKTSPALKKGPVPAMHARMWQGLLLEPRERRRSQARPCPSSIPGTSLTSPGKKRLVAPASCTMASHASVDSHWLDWEGEAPGARSFWASCVLCQSLIPPLALAMRSRCAELRPVHNGGQDLVTWSLEIRFPPLRLNYYFGPSLACQGSPPRARDPFSMSSLSNPLSSLRGQTSHRHTRLQTPQKIADRPLP